MILVGLCDFGWFLVFLLLQFVVALAAVLIVVIFVAGLVVAVFLPVCVCVCLVCLCVCVCVCVCVCMCVCLRVCIMKGSELAWARVVRSLLHILQLRRLWAHLGTYLKQYRQLKEK